MYKVGLYTLGCKVSQYETAAVGEEFERRGFLLCDFNTVCDVYVINTCTVTAESDRKSRQIIRRAIKNNPDAIVLVMDINSNHFSVYNGDTFNFRKCKFSHFVIFIRHKKFST